jgi:methyl-accepting chemotaxis protein
MITEEIKAMREGIGKIRAVSGETVETMGEMFREVTDMEKSFGQVRQAVEAQATNGGRILTALGTLRGTAEQVRRGSGEIERESGSIHEVVEGLKGISREVNERVVEVQGACQEIAQSLEVAQKIAEGRYLTVPENAGS